MDQFISQIPTTITGWVLTIVIAITGVTYLFSRIRQTDMTLLRNTNTDFQIALDMKGKEMDKMHQQITILNDKVSVLERQNKTLEDLVVTALKQFFFENPTVASDLKKRVLK